MYVASRVLHLHDDEKRTASKRVVLYSPEDISFAILLIVRYLILLLSG